MMDDNNRWDKDFPEQWERVPLKSKFTFGKGLSIKKTDLTEQGENVISYGQIHAKWNSNVHCHNELLRHVPQTFCNGSDSSIAKRNGFIFADTSEDLDGVGNCAFIDSDKTIYAGYHTVLLTPIEDHDNKYLAYLFTTDTWRYQIRRHLTEVKVFSISQKTLKQTYIVLPPSDIQHAIASFLDRKCAAIDDSIAKHKAIIEKLEEYRKAEITRAVTKGLNPDAKMKDASFLWLQSIPEAWGIFKLSHILDFNHPYPLGDGDHGSIKANDYANTGIPFIRVQNLGYAEPINTNNMVYITPEQNETIKNSTLHPGDILFAKTGATIGKTAIVPPSIAIANTTSHVGKITVDLTCFYPKYIYYALSSEVGNHQLWEIAGKKATRPEVGLDEVKYLKLLIPFSLDEQKQIADYLDAILDKCDTAINQHTQIISKLEEYKKSLIYNAVTGKIDCREGA